jgi:hypothetical protein
MEPEWTKKISSGVVCNFYYFFFVFYAVVAVITIVGTIALFSQIKLPTGMIIASTFQSLIVFALAAVSALFHYLVCDRALKPGNEKMDNERVVDRDADLY